MTTKTKRLSSLGARRSLNDFLGLEAQNTQELIGQIQAGLPFSAFETFQRIIGLPASQIQVVLPSSTLSRQKKQGQLNAAQSERLVRLAQVSKAAVDLFEGDTKKAREWMQKPRAALGDKTPLEMASTDLGAREVETLILRLEEGVFS